MSGSLTDAPIAVRPFAGADRAGVLEILRAAFGRWPRALEGVAPGEFFSWKHEQSPFGRSILLVAEADDALAGFLALMPWRLSLHGEAHQTIRGVDIAVHPSAQRRGVSVALIAAARGCYDEQIALGWSNPNERSRRGRAQVRAQACGSACLAMPAWACRSARRGATQTGAGALGRRRAERDIASVLDDDALLARALTPGGGGVRRSPPRATLSFCAGDTGGGAPIARSSPRIARGARAWRSSACRVTAACASRTSASCWSSATPCRLRAGSCAACDARRPRTWSCAR